MLQLQQNQIKIPQIFADQLLQQQPTQTIYYFTIFTIPTKSSYIINISLTPSQTLPLSLSSTSPSFSIQKQSFTKQSKQNILKKYTICSCDQLNQLTKQYLIINFIFSGYLTAPSQILGYSFYLNTNTTTQKSQTKQNHQQPTKYNICNFSNALDICKNYTLSIWNTYTNKSSKFIKTKQKDKTKSITSTIQLFLQFQFTLLQTIKYPNTFQPQLQQLQKYYHQYSVIFPITSQQHTNPSPTNINNLLTQKLHQIQQNNVKDLSLPLYLKSPNAHPQKIFNPHLFAKYQKKQKYQFITVKGFYQYYHYNDQNYCDRGWGCAYRSLQTVLSWLHIQGYADQLTQMLTIPAIQQKLDLIDYKSKLKNTKTWIGTTQISRIISTQTTPQINCKILHLNDGKKINQFYQQLKNYLTTTGCPIIYCGGQYAYMIVGIYYNWKLGLCQFLILDPHYQGEDDYSKIIQQNGLSFKKPQDIFKINTFYNFCLPLIQ